VLEAYQGVKGYVLSYHFFNLNATVSYEIPDFLGQSFYKTAFFFP